MDFNLEKRMNRLNENICKGQFEEVKKLISSPTDALNFIQNNENFENPFHCAAYHKRSQIMKWLLENSDPCFIETYINGFNSYGHTPLMRIFPTRTESEIQDCIKIVKSLLEHGADPQLTNEKSESFFTYALDQWDVSLIKLVLPYVDINFIDKHTEDNALLHVLNHYNDGRSADVIKIIMLLLEYGSNHLHKNKNNKTALDVASSKNIPLLDMINKNSNVCRHPLKIIMLGDKTVKGYVHAIFQPTVTDSSIAVPWTIEENVLFQNNLKNIELEVLNVNFDNGTKVAIWDIPQMSIYRSIHKQLINLKHSIVLLFYKLDDAHYVKMLCNWIKYLNDCKEYSCKDFIGFCFVALGESKQDILSTEDISHELKSFTEACDNLSFHSFVINKPMKNSIGFRKLRSYLLNLASTKGHCTMEVAISEQIILDILNCKKEHKSRPMLKPIKEMHKLSKQYTLEVLSHAVEKLYETGQVLIVKNYQDTNYCSIVFDPEYFCDVLCKIFKASNICELEKCRIDNETLILLDAVGIDHAHLRLLKSIEFLPEKAKSILVKHLNCLIGLQYGYKHLSDAFGFREKNFTNIETLLEECKNVNIQTLINKLNKTDMGMLAEQVELYL